jgi:hypothetical protein
MQPAPACGLDDVDHTRLTGGRQSPLVQGNLDACYGLAETPCEAAAQRQYPSIWLLSRHFVEVRVALPMERFAWPGRFCATDVLAHETYVPTSGNRVPRTSLQALGPARASTTRARSETSGPLPTGTR